MTEKICPRCKLLEKQVVELERQNAELWKQNEELKQALKSTRTKFEEEIAELKQQIGLLKKELFGKKSERRAPRIPKTKKNEEPAPKGRQPLPENLERKTIEYDIAESDKICPCCGVKLEEMPAVTTEQLAFRPAKLYVKRHTRKQYVCPKCHQTIKTAKMPDQPIDKGLPDAALLTEIIINKYEDALPLYRQMKRWARLGYEIADSTLSDWVQTVGELLKPLLKEMAKDIVEGKSVNADETPIPIQAPGKTHQGYIWVYIGEKAVVYQYGETRAYKNAEEFLRNFKGYIQADAYGAYDVLCDGEKRIKLGCWAHCRRKFNDVLINQPNHRIAKEVIDRIGKLYQIERELVDVTEQKRVTERRARAGPILEKLYTWLKSKNVLPKSRLGKAIQYTFNQWESLTRYLDVGFMGIDNNVSERAMRPITLGRKNYLCVSRRRRNQDENIKLAA